MSPKGMKPNGRHDENIKLTRTKEDAPKDNEESIKPMYCVFGRSEKTC